MGLSPASLADNDKMAVYVSETGGDTMPEFTTVLVQEAQLRTTPGRQGKFINEFADYIQQVPKGQAGWLKAAESENPLTIRRRLVSAAMALGVPLTIKRSGNDLYFWREDSEAEQPRQRRGRRPRTGRPGSLLPPTTQLSTPEEVRLPDGGEETTALDQEFTAVE
jgi:hypothetical protein